MKLPDTATAHVTVCNGNIDLEMLLMMNWWRRWWWSSSFICLYDNYSLGFPLTGNWWLWRFVEHRLDFTNWFRFIGVVIILLAHELDHFWSNRARLLDNAMLSNTFGTSIIFLAIGYMQYIDTTYVVQCWICQILPGSIPAPLLPFPSYFLSAPPFFVPALSCGRWSIFYIFSSKDCLSGSVVTARLFARHNDTVTKNAKPLTGAHVEPS